MKKIHISLIALFIAQISFSQTITELAGGIETSFEITTVGKSLGVTDQCIIKRAVQITGSDSYGEGIGMFGLGYESFHLEFIASQPLEGLQLSLPGPLFKLYPKYDFYELVFWGHNDEEILRRFIKRWYLNIFKDKFGKIDGYIYSIDMKDIPLIVLNKTKRIDISMPEVIREY